MYYYLLFEWTGLQNSNEGSWPEGQGLMLPVPGGACKIEAKSWAAWATDKDSLQQ